MRGQEAREILYDVPHELNELVRIRRLWLAINSCLEPLWQFIKQTAEKARLLAFDLEHASVVHATEEQRWRNLADATLPNAFSQRFRVADKEVAGGAPDVPELDCLIEPVDVLRIPFTLAVQHGAVTELEVRLGSPPRPPRGPCAHLSGDVQARLSEVRRHEVVDRVLRDPGHIRGCRFDT